MTEQQWEKVYAIIGDAAMEIDKVSGGPRQADEGLMKEPYALLCKALFEMYQIRMKYWPSSRGT